MRYNLWPNWLLYVFNLSSFCVTSCLSLFIFVLASSFCGCFLLSLFLFFLLRCFNLSLTFSSSPLLLSFPFSFLFSLRRRLFHSFLLYFIIPLPSHLHCLIRSFFFSLRVSCLFSYVSPLCVSFLSSFLALSRTLVSTFFSYFFSCFVAFLRHSGWDRHRTGI